MIDFPRDENYRMWRKWNRNLYIFN